MRNIEIAVVYDANGKCTHLSNVKMVNKQELNKLTNEKNKKDSERELLEKGFLDELQGNTKTIQKLLTRDLILAKSVYDNFVDRGIIENDENFQQLWYDFYFNGCELNLSQAPQEYKTILEKVGNF